MWGDVGHNNIPSAPGAKQAQSKAARVLNNHPERDKKPSQGPPPLAQAGLHRPWTHPDPLEVGG